MDHARTRRENTTTSSSSSSSSRFHSQSSPIQRLLILHTQLHELDLVGAKKKKTGTGLSETASVDERLGRILYYYHPSVPPEGGGGGTGSTATNDDACWWKRSTRGKEEAVQFADFCTALYSLPSAFAASSVSCDDANDAHKTDDNDHTQSMFFGNSLLVFVPLEASPHSPILAVVQIARLNRDGRNTQTTSGSCCPLAITASMERSHHLFCLLRGGGIRRRLQQHPRSVRDEMTTASTDETQDDNAGPDPGWGSNDHMFREASLPMEQLRHDLTKHYNEYLSHFQESSVRNGRSGRCLVDLLPVPIASTDSWTHAIQSSPSSLGRNHSTEELKRRMHQLLHRSSSGPSPHEHDSNLLVGISIFHDGVHMSDSNRGTIEIPTDSLSLLMAYMASYRTKIHHAAMCVPPPASSSSVSSFERQPGILQRLALSMSPMVEEAVHTTRLRQQFEDTNSSCKDLHRRGQFIPCPPAYMMGATDEICSIKDDDKPGVGIWVPRISIPIESTAEDKFLDLHMAVFDYKKFSFLVFLDLSLMTTTGKSSRRNSSAITSFMLNLEEHLSRAVNSSSDKETKAAKPLSIPSKKETKSRTAKHWSAEPGQDIIVLERSKQKMILLTDPKHLLSRRDQKIKSSANVKERRPRRFWNIANDKTLSQPCSFDLGSTALEWSAWGLDCRHLLGMYRLIVCYTVIIIVLTLYSTPLYLFATCYNNTKPPVYP